MILIKSNESEVEAMTGELLDESQEDGSWFVINALNSLDLALSLAGL